VKPANEWTARKAKWFDPLMNQWRAGVFFSNVIDGFPEQEVGAVISNAAVAERMAEALAALPVLVEWAKAGGQRNAAGVWHTDSCRIERRGDPRGTCTEECVEVRAALKAAGVEVGA
jgi:hypothetical protein